MNKKHTFSDNVIYDERSNSLFVNYNNKLSIEDEIFIRTYNHLMNKVEFKIFNGLIGEVLKYDNLIIEYEINKNKEKIDFNLNKYNF